MSCKAELESSEKRWMWTAQNPAAARFDSCAAGLFAPRQALYATPTNLCLLHIIYLRRRKLNPVTVGFPSRCDSRATRVADFLSLPMRLHVCVPSRIAVSLAPWDAEECAALRSSSLWSHLPVRTCRARDAGRLFGHRPGVRSRARRDRELLLDRSIAHPTATGGSAQRRLISSNGSISDRGSLIVRNGI